MREPNPAQLERASVATLPASAAAHLSEAASLQNLTYEDPLAILGTAPHPDEPWWKRLSPSTILVLLSGAIGIFFLLHELLIAGKLGLPVDESWIEQVYARNFFRHISFEFNPGQVSAGPTAPLWVVALSVGNGIFHNPMLAAKLLGSIFLFLTGYYVFRLLRTTEHDYGSALLASVLTISAQHLAWSELSGLESTLSAALVMAGIWWFFESHGGWRRSLTGALFALAALARPETSIIFLLLLVYSVTHADHADGGHDEHRLRDPVLMLLLFLIILVPIAATNIAISGSVVPVTFFAGLARDSFPVLLRHGRIVDLALRLVYSIGSIGSIVWDVYLPTNPLFVFTIVAAFGFRQRGRHVHRNSTHELLTFCTILLVLFPYIRAVVLGVNDSFGDNARLVHFIEPVYIVAGLLSIKELVERLTLRVLTPRQTLYVSACALVTTTVVYLALRPEVTASFFTLKGSIDFILLLFFTGVLLSVALAYAGIHPFKPELPDFVTEEERQQYTYHSHDETDGDRALPNSLKNVLRGVLLVTLAWNLTELPRSANEYAEGIREMNAQLAFAKSVSERTQPTDVIAADNIGALGWASDRVIYDIQGRLTNDASYNRRMLGLKQGAIATLKEARPSYVAIASEEYRDIARGAESAGAFIRVLPPEQDRLPALYRFDAMRLP